MDPVIIECAINAVTSKATNPHVPVEPSEIAEDALACIEAGAAIIRNHIDRYGLGVEEAAQRYRPRLRHLPSGEARPEPRHLRTRLPSHDSRVVASGPTARRHDDQALLLHRAGLPRSALRPSANPARVRGIMELLDGCDVPWAVSLVGGDLCASDLAMLALERGGHLHVGLEFYGGDRTPTNVELVSEAVNLCGRASRSVATPDQAAKLLGLSTAG